MVNSGLNLNVSIISSAVMGMQMGLFIRIPHMNIFVLFYTFAFEWSSCLSDWKYCNGEFFDEKRCNDCEGKSWAGFGWTIVHGRIMGLD